MYNYVDIVIVLILAFHIVQGIRRGIWPLLARLLSFGFALVAAFCLYQWSGRLILARYDLIPSVGYGLGFIVTFMVAQIILHIMFAFLLRIIPAGWHTSLVSRALAVVPAAIDGLIFVTLLVLLVVVFPVSAGLRRDVTASKTASMFIDSLQRTEQYSQKLFGNVLDEALTFLTTRPDSNESVNIPYRPDNPTVDDEAESRMLELVNSERAKAGAGPLVVDPVLVEIARSHSHDMWSRGYFSHYDPDGNDPFVRMRRGGAEFIVGGENLAYSPSVGLAHRGLMNSPGHKRNILDPRFGRVGIGVVDGGIYGKMFTQVFAD